MDLTLHRFFKDIILEGAESRNMGLAKHYLYDKRGMDEPQAMRTIGAIKTDIPNVRLAKCKFILGVTRLFCNGELSDGSSITSINKYLRYIASDAHVNEYNQNLNGLSLGDIESRFSSVAKGDLEADKERMNQQEFDSSSSQYKIVNIDSFDEASKYGEYTDWCVTHYDDMYDSYTHNGLGRFYFCLKDGFENVPREKGEGCPLDEYGLSMIAVSVNEDGSCNTITCRWNHDNGGGDNIMTPQELSEIIGMNFYKVFLPYSKEEIAEKKKEIVNIIYDTYNSFVSEDFGYMHTFDDELNSYYNDEEDAYYDDDGYEIDDTDNESRNMLKDKEDIKDVDGDLDIIAYGGFADDERLQDMDPVPSILINTRTDELIVDGLFDFQMDFNYVRGFVSAKPLGSKGTMLIDVENKKYLSDTVFSTAYLMYSSASKDWVALVGLDGKMNVIKNDGSYLFDEWIDGAMSQFGQNGMFSVTYKDNRRVINSNGDTVINNIELGSHSYFKPFPDGKFFFIKHTDGKIYAYSSKDCSMFAPWCISQLLGSKSIKTQRQTSQGTIPGYQWLYRVKMINGDDRLLDKECNVHDLQSGELIEKNPYFTKNESRRRIGSLLEQSIIRFILSEGSNIWDIYEKYYNGKISKDDFKALNDADPTSKGDNKGKYLPWLIKYYLNGEINLNSNISTLLQWYNSHKSMLGSEYKDIMRMTPSDLMHCYYDNKDTAFNKEDIKNQIAKVYEDDEWIIYIPYTYNASRYLVWHMLGGSEWCTAAQGSGGQYYFDHYTDDDNHLYVNVRKKDGEIFQYAPLTGDYMDRHDEPLTIGESMMSSGAIKWYKDNGISLEANASKFPVGDDIYDGGYWGLKCLNDLYAEYKVCDPDGNIIEGLPQVEFPSIRYESEDCIITSTSDRNGSCIFALPHSKFYEYIDDDNRLYFESTFNDDDSKFMFVNDDEKVFIYNLSENKMEFEENCSDISFFDGYMCIYTDYSELYIFGKSDFDFKLKLKGDYFNFFGKDGIEYTSSKDGETHVFNLTTMEDKVDNGEDMP